MQQIVALSVADTWAAARLEWGLEQISFAYPEAPGTCICGKTPIHEVCVLRNRKNGKKAVVGNVCVTRCLGLPADKLFAALRRVRLDRKKALNAEMVAFAYDQGWIDKWQYDFSLNTLRRQQLSPSQMKKRIEVNDAVLAHASVPLDDGEGRLHA